MYKPLFSQPRKIVSITDVQNCSKLLETAQTSQTAQNGSKLFKLLKNKVLSSLIGQKIVIGKREKIVIGQKVVIGPLRLRSTTSLKKSTGVLEYVVFACSHS